jgi:hypothetical protein
MMDTPQDGSARARQQAHYMALAAKHRERADRALGAALAESHVKLAEGYEMLADTLRQLSLFPSRRSSTG